MRLSLPSNHVPCSLHTITAGPFPWEEELGTREATEGGGGDRERLSPVCQGRGGNSPTILSFGRWLWAASVPPFLGTDPQNEVGKMKEREGRRGAGRTKGRGKKAGRVRGRRKQEEKSRRENVEVGGRKALGRVDRRLSMGKVLG